MRGETDPWMFHQANLRDLGGGQSLITAFLDAVLAKYSARATFPIVEPDDGRAGAEDEGANVV